MRLLVTIIIIGLSGCASKKDGALCSVDTSKAHESVRGISFRAGFHGELVKAYYRGKLILSKKLTTNASTSSAGWVEIKDDSRAPKIRVIVEAGGSKIDSDKDPKLCELNAMFPDIILTPIPVNPEIHGRLIQTFDIDWKLGPIVNISIMDSRLIIQQSPAETLM